MEYLIVVGVVAMMAPLVLDPLRWVAFQSFRHRRHRAVLCFLAGFLLPWVFAGLAAAGLRTLDWIHNPRIRRDRAGGTALLDGVSVVFAGRAPPFLASQAKSRTLC